MEPFDVCNLKIITSTHYNRPDCTKSMLEHLSRCTGIENYILLCGVEPGFPEVINEINKYKFRKMVFLNQSLLGCWANKKSVVAEGFKLSKYVIHVEDDVLLAKDALKYFEWAKKYSWDKSVFSVTAFSKNEVLNPNLVIKNGSYRSIAWATWHDRHNEMKSRGWNGSDSFIMNRFRGYNNIYPAVSRAKHIGTENGIGSEVSLKSTVETVGHSAYAYAGLAFHDSNVFVQNRKAYIEALKSTKDTQHPNVRRAMEHQIKVAESGPFERQLIVNPNFEEWVKLDDNNVKSRNKKEYEQYEIDMWSDDVANEFNYYD